MKLRYAGYSCMLCCVLLFLSCRMSSREQSFTAKLDAVDVAVSIGDTASAVKLLDALAKQPYGAFQRLGIYRRYMALGQTAAAEKYLIAGLKKLPANPELTAVYVWFLSEQGRTSEALAAAVQLENTQYASVFSELKIRSVSGTHNFTDPGFSEIYADAYISSKNDLWLQNAAAIQAAGGKAKSVSFFVPATSCSFPLFWAYLAYDAGRYADALDYIAEAEFDSTAAESGSEAGVLKTDILTVLGDTKAAERERDAVIAQGSAPAAVYYNSALYAKRTGNTEREYSLLNKLVSVYPDYIPGLDLYMDFALRCAALPPEDVLARAVRAAGMQSAGMKAYDAVPRISVDDAFSLMNDALGRSKDPFLAGLIYRYGIDAAVNPDSENQKKGADLWLLLEQYTDSSGILDGRLAAFAVPVFISLGEPDEARRVFDTYVQKTYGSAVYADILPQMSAAECEYAAYFSASGIGGKADIAAAQYIYDYLANEKKETYPALAENAEYEPPCSVLVNLAELYAGTRKYDAAKRLYSTAAGITSDTQLKAEILYRLADMQFDAGQKRAALLSADYCLSLNSSHAGARLLRKKLNAVQ